MQLFKEKLLKAAFLKVSGHFYQYLLKMVMLRSSEKNRIIKVIWFNHTVKMWKKMLLTYSSNFVVSMKAIIDIFVL